MEKLTDILIVEDNLLIAETIRETLINAGYENVRIVVSVEEAVLEIKNSKPGLVLTDIELGKGKNGIDLGNLLNTTYFLPFIYITSHSSPEILSRAKHTHPNAYIVKPFKSADLLVAIEFALFNAVHKGETIKEDEALVVKEGRAIVKINYSDIVWLESSGNYTIINLSNFKRRVIRDGLTEFENQLNPAYFIRIHKSFLVNKSFVTEVRAAKLFIKEHEFPIGRTYQTDVNSSFLK